MSEQRKKTKKSAAEDADASAFAAVFEDSDSEIAAAAQRLREIILDTGLALDQNVSGGSKVRLVLYSSGGPDRVVCGLQPAAGRCMLYVHRIEAADVPEYKLAGKGKHAKRIDFENCDAIEPGVVERLVRLSMERMS